MGKKKKKKYSTKQIIIYLIVVAGIIYLGIFIDETKENSRKNSIKQGHFNVYATVEKLKPHARKGRRYTSRKDVVYLYYERNDSVFHIIDNLHDGQLKKLGVILNDCFAMKIAESDHDIFEIDFTKKIDTFIDKTNFQHQVYKTKIHKNLIEK